MPQFLVDFWPFFTAGMHLTFAIGASLHVVLTKTDTRAAIGWIGLIWLTPLVGNNVIPLVDGDEAYPSMLEAIDDAERSIGLSTYILNHDQVGKRKDSR